MYEPSPALTLLRGAAALLGDPADRLVDEIARDYPRSLARRPAQLVRAAKVAPDTLAELVRAAGFVDLDAVRAHAGRERSVPRPRRAVAGPRRDAPADRTDLGLAMRREQAAVAASFDAVRSSGSLELAAGAILGSRRRWVFGDLRSRGFAQLFAGEVMAALGQVVLVDPTAAGVLAAVGDAQRRDSLTVFTFRRHSRLSVRLVAQFAARGTPVVAVTDDEHGAVADDATHVLRVADHDGGHSPTAAVAVAHALATLVAAGAKGAARRAEQERAVAADLRWYEEDPA
ncbi:MurR/RpiR family transcriptional regulator [Jatrophihabitans endophyticus]|uniref:MurR/RpiR family transcriptional regulator n=1 Tax=Jatrophihabitans endophyticus TaxID=1206085 RepID=UPI0009336844|nr:SIS domain-containing protein [Jatrophihabitans endophyticus]